MRRQRIQRKRKKRCLWTKTVEGKVVWRVIGSDGEPITKDITLNLALCIARDTWGGITLNVWNDDRKMWDSEIVADPAL